MLFDVEFKSETLVVSGIGEQTWLKARLLPSWVILLQVLNLVGLL